VSTAYASALAPVDLLHHRLHRDITFAAGASRDSERFNLEDDVPAQRKRSELPFKRKKGPDARDIAVGQRVRALRLERSLSQTSLGDRLGVTFQQVQKYEKGVNRIGASRLQAIAGVFNVPISALFSESPAKPEQRDSLFELVDSAGALRLLRAYQQLPNYALKNALVQLALEMAEEKGKRGSR
jgi:transcriptional regulator with XRE-family HTH domain